MKKPGINSFNQSHYLCQFERPSALRCASFSRLFLLIVNHITCVSLRGHQICVAQAFPAFVLFSNNETRFQIHIFRMTCIFTSRKIFCCNKSYFVANARFVTIYSFFVANFCCLDIFLFFCVLLYQLCKYTPDKGHFALIESLTTFDTLI